MGYKLAPLRLAPLRSAAIEPLLRQLSAWSEQVTAAVNSLGAGAAQASGNPGSILSTLSFSGTDAAIAISQSAHFVSGSGSLATIIAPRGFSGAFFMIARSQFTLAASGNIALAAALTVQADQLVVMFYDGARWYLALA